VSTRTSALVGALLGATAAGCGVISGLDALEEQACAPDCSDASGDARTDASDTGHDASVVPDADGGAGDATDAADAAEAQDTQDATAGDAADAAETNPCEAVTCDQRPASVCASATELRVYTAMGTCDQGTCKYTSSLTTCPFGCAGDQCTGDPCVGVSCQSPAKSYCSDATHLTVYEAPGSCGAGKCSYASHQEYCNFGCTADVCNGDPCVGVTCNKPPASYCADASNLTVYASNGTCASGTCTYTKATQYCAFGCAAGACLGDPCAGVSCTMPTASYCTDAKTLRTFSGPGTCTAGSCGYPSTDKPCPGGCVLGVCKECATTPDCPAGKWCNAGSCAGCGDDLHCGSACTDCSATGRICNGGTTCVQCVLDSQCASGSYCSGNTCATCNTAAKCGASCTACSGTTPACGGSACVCNATSCATNQACTAGACAVCKSDAACGPTCGACGAPKPKCLDQGATSTCVQCLSTADCGSGQVCTGNACVTPCTGTIVDWNWNAGTGPSGSALTTQGTSWSVGAATYGPADGLTYLATKPATGSYASTVNDWVRLPKIDLTAYATCKVKVSVNLWVRSEVGTLPYDGGNLQYTVDPTAASGWTLMDGGSMAYDGTFSTLSCASASSCFLYGQKIWANDTGVTKAGTFTSPAALGSALTLRFTFHSDDSIVRPGIYVKRVLVEATP
jgi:hypothetical protein